MTISILIPAHNEEKSIKKCVESCLRQTRKPDEIIVINDGSSDKTGQILQEFIGKIKIINLYAPTGSKSFAQEIGLSSVWTDVFVCTDADTVLDNRFLGFVERDFQEPDVEAVSGYVKSQKANWLTVCRGLEYAIGQNFHKLAQSYIDVLFVIPGAAGAFRTETFRKTVVFGHDTLAEDLDFTFKFHERGLKIKYDTEAVVYTQDPMTLPSYINQMRRWSGGGWQNLLKHYRKVNNPASALELSLIYFEGLVFSFLFFLMPLINIWLTACLFIFYFLMLQVLAILAAVKEKRPDLLSAPLPYLLLIYLNAYIFIEQFFNEFLFKKKNLKWFQPERFNR